MKPFSFRLDSILNYRNYLEKRARRNLANAISEYIGWEREIERLSKKRIEIAGKCSDEGLRGMDVPKYHMYRSFLQRVGDDLERANMSLKKTEEKIEEKKEIVETKAAALEPVEKAVMAYLIGAMLAVAIGLIIVKQRIGPRYADEGE